MAKDIFIRSENVMHQTGKPFISVDGKDFDSYAQVEDAFLNKGLRQQFVGVLLGGISLLLVADRFVSHLTSEQFPNEPFALGLLVIATVFEFMAINNINTGKQIEDRLSKIERFAGER